jgi:hypothetical protein
VKNNLDGVAQAIDDWIEARMRDEERQS